MIEWIEKMDQLVNEHEQLVLGGQDVTEGSQKQTCWDSVFRRRARRRKAPEDAEGELFKIKKGVILY